MPKASEGVRRLSLFAGGVVSFLWFGVILLWALSYPYSLKANDWVGFAVSLAAAFFVPFVFVRAAAWVIAGFRDER